MENLERKIYDFVDNFVRPRGLYGEDVDVLVTEVMRIIGEEKKPPVPCFLVDIGIDGKRVAEFIVRDIAAKNFSELVGIDFSKTTFPCAKVVGVFGEPDRVSISVKRVL